MTIEEYLSRHKERWYLRDLDFLPEKLSEYKNLSWNLVQEIESEESSFKTFTSEIEAIRASLAIRELMKMENKGLIEILNNKRNEELKSLENFWIDFNKNPRKYELKTLSSLEYAYIDFRKELEKTLGV